MDLDVGLAELETDPLIEKQKRRWNEQRSNEKKCGPERLKMGREKKIGRVSITTRRRRKEGLTIGLDGFSSLVSLLVIRGQN